MPPFISIPLCRSIHKYGKNNVNKTEVFGFHAEISLLKNNNGLSPQIYGQIKIVF